jgi:HSP90 family molecular chaperone
MYQLILKQKKQISTPLKYILGRSITNSTSINKNVGNINSLDRKFSSINTPLFSTKLSLNKIINNNNIRYNSTTNAPETREFLAETRKLLDIVTNSIYTDKEVFIRELISNSSDALEKYRYMQVRGEVSIKDDDATNDPLTIEIITDEANKTLTIIDNGIGMNRDELINNLGTIARSGSKAFVEQNDKSEASTDGIIGQFGVGFYSSFMVSDSVSFESISASEGTTDLANKWSSDGSGKYTIEELPKSDSLNKRGSKLTLNLKDSSLEFADSEKILSIIKKYSNFVAFPIKVNGEVVNTVSAIWVQDKKTVTEEEYDKFYQFISNAYDKPKFTLHFQADAPIDLKCLFYIPSFHSEKFGMGRMETGVNLYSKKILIESKPKDLLPEWLRFVKGVVDSEDLPLSLSREKPQDSTLLNRIRDVLTRKLIRFLEQQSKNEPEKFKEFYMEYNYFLKEGVCHDYKFVDQISKLLLFESSGLDEGNLTSFDDYISRSSPEEKNIYYVIAPSRSAALKSPYYETFKKHNKEVLFLYSTIDDFVMSNIKTFSGRTLVSAETSSVNLEETKDDEEDKSIDDNNDNKKKLSTQESEELCGWLQFVLEEKKVKQVKVTNRLSDSPAIVTDHESGALRRMLKMVDQQNQGVPPVMPPQVLEINPKHPIIVSLFHAKDGNSESVSKLCAEQIFDNALVAAGLIDDPRTMLSRLNDILEATLKK